MWSAIIYIGFSLINIIFDLISKNYKASLFQFIMIILTLMINMLCNIGLNIIAWFLVLLYNSNDIYINFISTNIW